MIFILSSPQPNVCQCGKDAPWHVATGNVVMQLCDSDLARFLALWKGKDVTTAAQEFRRTPVIADQ
jgi:hypothetical protein